MKTIKLIAFLIFAFVATSCVAPIQYGPVTPYNSDSEGFNRGLQQRERRITGYNKVAHTTNLRAFIKLGADAPQEVVQRVEQSTANQVGFEYAQSFESGGKPVWPSYTRVTQIAEQKLAVNGYNLTPGQPGQPGRFKVMKYTPGVK